VVHLTSSVPTRPRQVSTCLQLDASEREVGALRQSVSDRASLVAELREAHAALAHEEAEAEAAAAAETLAGLGEAAAAARGNPRGGRTRSPHAAAAAERATALRDMRERCARWVAAQSFLGDG
jgi:hypothetical protein